MVMAYIVMAYIVMACVLMAYIVMAYAVMALARFSAACRSIRGKTGYLSMPCPIVCAAQ